MNVNRKIQTKRRFFMDDWTIANTWGVLDGIAEKNANAEFISACKNGDLSKIEFELQHGRDPNLAVLKKSPLWYAKDNPDAVKFTNQRFTQTGYIDRESFRDTLHSEIILPVFTSNLHHLEAGLQH